MLSTILPFLPRLTPSIYGAVCAPLITDLFTTLWANTTIITASLFGQSVSGWTRSSPKFRIFLCRRDTQSIMPGLAARAQNSYGQYELFCSAFAQVTSLAFGATRSCSQSRSHNLAEIAAWFVAVGVLTAGMMM